MAIEIVERGEEPEPIMSGATCRARRWDAPVDVACLDAEIPIQYQAVDDPQWPGVPMTERQAQRDAAVAGLEQVLSSDPSSGMTRAEVARQMGVSDATVKAIEWRALRKLRRLLLRLEGFERWQRDAVEQRRKGTG